MRRARVVAATVAAALALAAAVACGGGSKPPAHRGPWKHCKNGTIQKTCPPAHK